MLEGRQDYFYVARGLFRLGILGRTLIINDVGPYESPSCRSSDSLYDNFTGGKYNKICKLSFFHVGVYVSGSDKEKLECYSGI